MQEEKKEASNNSSSSSSIVVVVVVVVVVRGIFRPRQTRQLPRVVDLKGRLLSCQSY